MFNISYIPTFCFWFWFWLQILLPSFPPPFPSLPFWHSFISVTRCLSNFLCSQTCLSSLLLLPFAVKAKGLSLNIPLHCEQWSLEQFMDMCTREYTSPFHKAHMEKERELQVAVQDAMLRGEESFSAAMESQNWSPQQFFSYTKGVRHLHGEDQKLRENLLFLSSHEVRGRRQTS